MAVRDFITKEVVYMSPDTTVAHAADMVKEQGLRRLPIIENDKLVGIVTEGVMAEAGPSKATTLLTYEMDYLLNKTKTRNMVIRDVVTVSPYASLEDTIYTMMKNRVGIAPVTESGQVYGVITNRDVFKTFLEISGYGGEGIRVTISADDTVGTLAKIVDTISNDNLNIKRIVVATRESGKAAVEIQINGKADIVDSRKRLFDQGIQVGAIELTGTKSLD